MLDGLSRLDQLAKRAKTLNQPALALTDHGVMFGVMPFYQACKDQGVKPIIGIETYVAARRMTDRDSQLDRERTHLLLLAENQTGYLNLLQLASAAQLEGFYYRPRIDLDTLAAHSDGLICTTGCMAADIPRAIAAGDMTKAHTLMGRYLDIFGPERFFIELQEHSIPELTAINKILTEDMQPRYNLRFVATNDVHYTTPEEASPHDVLLCIQTGATVNESKRMRFSDTGYYLKSHEEMRRLFGHIPGALDNSLLIAEMCNVDLDTKGYHLPLFDVPDGQDAPGYLRRLCEEGLVRHYGAERAAKDEALRARLEHELRIIGGMGFDAYFLIVWDLCEYARRAGIWWNVRGSGAGSLVAYTLGITGIDPIANGLIFERFLNPGRVSMPDIDLDYPDDRRSEMVEYAVNKYGQDKVAQIITFGTLGARAAIRDVGRALDIPLPEVDAVARLIPAIPGKPAKIINVLDKDHEFYSADLEAKVKGDPRIKELIDTAQQLEGVARHASSHAAGVLISDKPLVQYVPLHKPTSGEAGLGGIRSISQWPMEIVEKIGLLKVDFLGLSTLTVMRLAAQLIEQRHGVRYTMDNIPYDIGMCGPGQDKDKGMEPAFDMLGRGDVLGVFQVEGSGMRKLMMEMKPRRFDHIIAAISLFRPGPMENIPEYIRRMHAALNEGKDVVTYHTPELEPILGDTYGILVYQEQIIRIAAELAGYEPGEADMIRKAVSKKKRDLMDQHKIQFTSGAMKRGFSREVCEAIWFDIEFFARYGFNKAHAADYAVICCQTAYLKAHYPVEYITALLTVDHQDTEKIAKYVTDARRLGITVAPPSINRAMLDFTIEDAGEKGGKGAREQGSPPSTLRPSPPALPPSTATIRYGLAAIKNAGEAAVQLIIDEREANGPFKAPVDLAERVDLRRVGKRALESMARVGVFDEWGSRARILDALDRMMGHSSSTHAAAEAGQMSLFGGNGNGGAKIDVAILRPEKSVKPIDRRESLDWEKELIGVYLTEHPLEHRLADLQGVVTARTGELDPAWNGKAVTLAGLVAGLRTLNTKKGQPMAFVTLEDLDGKIDLVLFPRTWAACREQVQPNQIIVVRGSVQAEGESLSIIADSVQTKLTIAKDRGTLGPETGLIARESDFLPRNPMSNSGSGPGSPQQDDYWPPPDDWNEDYSAAPARPAGNGRPSHLAEPAPAYRSVVDDGLAPPPDEDDDDESDYGTLLPDDEPTRPDPAAVAEAQEPPPPPVVTMPERTTNDELRMMNETTLPVAQPAQVAPPTNGHSSAAAPPIQITDPPPNGSYKLLIVEIRASGDWKDACRRIIGLAERYEGNATLRLQLAGQGLIMDFPNHRTACEPELVEALERLPGVGRVYER
ncbi:MAG: DNA polymerase III subunit alpha [Candidatus Promineofilum sp.]|nr:DNA polymerase III subunit alpha [Promineifilum sp.]MCO5180386.1 DNA polymerase III subunit alpha [Promineifilum sp.]